MYDNSPAPAQQAAADLTAKPPQLSDRIAPLDVLRGLAVLAALFVSIWIFGGFTEQQQKVLLATSKGADYRAYGAAELLLVGKMSALIALVFGASMVLFLSRETGEGRKPAGELFIRRQLWLIILGVINAVLFLWTNDFLFHLGIMGILLFPFFRLGTRGLLVAALFTTLVYCGKYYWNFSDDQRSYNKYLAVTALEKKFNKDSVARAQKGLKAKKDTLTKLQQQDKQAWEGILAGVKGDPKKDDPNTKAMRSGSYGKTWNHLLPRTQSRQAEWTYRFGIWDMASMIFLGMLLYKIGFFNNRFSKSRYLLFALVAITGGLLLGWYRIHFQQIGMQDYTKFINRFSIPHNLFFPIERASMALGYASGVMALLSTGRIWRGLAAAGRMALTNYLAQTLICTLFFYGYGMGYFGRLTQWQLYFFALEVAMVQVVFSVIWLRYFNYGTAEWLLRRLTSGKWLPRPFRKPSATESPIPVLS